MHPGSKFWPLFSSMIYIEEKGNLSVIISLVTSARKTHFFLKLNDCSIKSEMDYEDHSSRKIAAPPPGFDTNRLCFSIAALRGSGR